MKAKSTRQLFVHWITEREKIRIAKEYDNQKKPWTDDPILQKYRFCNVRRMDDRVSKWLFNNWYQPYYNHSNMVIACTIARHFNNIEALDLIGFPKTIDLDRMYSLLRKRMDGGKRVFNGAYIIRGNDGRDKIDSVLNYTVRQMVETPPLINPKSMELTHLELMNYKDIGSFMAGQIVADLRFAVKGSWSDKRVWAPLGPGSKRGINRFFDRPITTPLSQEQFEEELSEVMNYCYLHLDDHIYKRMEAMDFQNCCCEFDKYMRTLSGEGKPKQNYLGV